MQSSCVFGGYLKIKKKTWKNHHFKRGKIIEPVDEAFCSEQDGEEL
jgi:hypothetical protein